MPEFLRTIPLWLQIAAVLGGSVLAGWVLQTVVLTRIRAAAGRTSWRGDDVIIDALRRAPMAWCVLAGLAWSVRLFGLSPEDFPWVYKGLLAAFILSVSLVLARCAAGFVRSYTAREDGSGATASLLATISKGVVLGVGLLVVFQTMGIEITAILTTLGVGGLAVALALQDTLSNFFAGVHVLLSRRVRQGDYIRLDSGEEGVVRDITWRDTTVETLPGNLVVIPNGKVSGAIVTNFDRPARSLSVPVPVGVGYGSDLERVEAVTLEVARELQRSVAGGVPDHEPVVRFQAFGDSSVNLTVHLRAQGYLEQFALRSEFIKRLHRRYAREGIEIPFPVRTVRLERAARDPAPGS